MLNGRNFAINYDGGFAIADNLDVLAYIMRQYGGIDILETDTLGRAYVIACQRFVDIEWRKQPGRRCILPRFEEVLQQPFNPTGAMPSVPGKRIFAAANVSGIGIFDSVEWIIAFAQTYRPIAVKESYDLTEAQNWINYRFLRYILPMGAYISAEAPYYTEIPLNTVVPISFREWMAEYCRPPQDLPFPQPIGLLADTDGKDGGRYDA